MKLVSQSTLDDNSTKFPVKTTNQSVLVVQGSKTTDDLLQLSLETSVINNVEYLNNKNRGSQVVNRHNSTLADKRSMMNFQDQGGVPTVIGKRNNMKSVLGDYSSQTHLPKVKDSLNFGNGQFKKIDPYNNQRSKVDLSKKELQNFQLTGVVSKDFIHQNKKELENFIKSQTRLRLENQGLDNSSSQIFGIDYSSQVDGSHLKKEATQTEEQKLLAGLDPSTFVFSDDVRPERGFQGETSQINSKVVENWINQTLTDAEHLDIPSVILKPENKIPITRYGIDRFTLSHGGLSNDSIDRVYRGLFVYSVGFYENLKKQMANCGSDQQLILMTSLWKTFNVLLEYCCKTDYRLLISKVTQKYDEEKQEIINKYKNLLQTEINEKKLLKQNMLVMQTYQEQLEKDRNNERSLRLKLEEEYMQIQRNHEEEVSLRLKFEGKLNQLSTAFRELEIKYDRVQQQLEQSLMHQNRLDQLCKVQSEELIQLRTRETDQLSQLDILRDFKQSALSEIEKKNKVIAASEESRKKAIDDADIIRYQVQDQNNQTRRLEIRIQDLTVGKISLENQIHTLESQIRDYEEKAEAQKKLFASERKKFEELAIFSTQNLEQLEALKVTSTDHQQLIEQLRQQISNEALRFEDHEMHALVYKTERDELKRELGVTKGDYSTTSTNLQLINADRHRFEDLYNQALNKIELLENVIGDNNRKIEQNLQLIQKQDQQIKELLDKKENLEKKIDTISKERDAQVNKLNQQIRKVEELLASTVEARDGLIQTVRDQQEEIGKKVTEIYEKEQYIQKLLKKIEKTQENIKLMKDQAASLQKQQLLEQNKADQERDNAQQALHKQHQLEETVRYLTQQQQSLQQNYSNQFKTMQEGFLVKFENLMMETEDAKSYLRPYYDKFIQAQSALDSVEEANKIKTNFEEFKRELQQVSDELGRAREKIQIQEDLLEEQDYDFDAIIQRVIEKEHERISEQEEKYVQKIKTLNEQLIKATLSEKALSKKFLKLEKQVEIMSKSSSQAQMKSSGQKRLVAGRSKESKSSNESIENDASQSTLKRTKMPLQNSELKKKTKGNFDGMIADAKKKKLQQENVNALIMGRQKGQNQNQTNIVTRDGKNLNRTVIPQKQFQPINIDNFNKQSGNATNRKDSQNNLDFVDQETTSQQNQDQVSNYEEYEDQSSIEEGVEGENDQDDYEVLAEATAEPEEPVVRDLQAEKFAEYLNYVLEKGGRFLESLKQYFYKISSGELIADSLAAKDYLKRIMLENEEKIPEKFANLHLTEDQKELLEQEQEMQKVNFQVDNAEILPPEESESDNESDQNRDKTQSVSQIRKKMFAKKSDLELQDSTEKSPAKKKQRKNNFSRIFSKFADNHSKFLDKLVKEHEERVAKAAQERRKLKEVNEKVDNQIRGRQKSHYLIKMKLDPDYYELHRGLLIEAIKKAEQDKANRQASLDVAEQEEKRKSSEVARLLLERHQAKLSKIVVEREYLNKKQADQIPQITKINVEQSQKSPMNEKSIQISLLDKQVSQQQSAKRLLVQHQDQNFDNEQQQQMQKPNQSSVQQILDVVNSMTNTTPQVDSEIKQYIKGGVAGLNRSYNQSNNKRVSTGPSAIRTLIRAVNSRAIN